MFFLDFLIEYCKKKASHLLSERLWVPGTGIEPVQPQWSQDFKS